MLINLNEAGYELKDPKYMIGVFLSAIGGIILVASSPIIYKEGRKLSNVNLSNLAFICAIAGQYGITIHCAHVNASKKTSDSNCKSCMTIEDHDRFTFYVLLMTFPMLIFTATIYPYPKHNKDARHYGDNRENQNRRKTNRNNEMMRQQNNHGHYHCAYHATFDTLDYADLVFGTVGCFLNYSSGWLAAYYAILGISPFLTAFSYGLEQRMIGNLSGMHKDLILTILRLLINDVGFFVLRMTVMVKEGFAHPIIIFTIKEVVSFLFRTGMIYKAHSITEKNATDKRQTTTISVNNKPAPNLKAKKIAFRQDEFVMW
eukprot:TCONS_00048415-protein